MERNDLTLASKKTETIDERQDDNFKYSIWSFDMESELEVMKRELEVEKGIQQKVYPTQRMIKRL